MDFAQLMLFGFLSLELERFEEFQTNEYLYILGLSYIPTVTLRYKKHPEEPLNEFSLPKAMGWRNGFEIKSNLNRI